MHDDRALFEMLTLEGTQADFSWSTISAKRENPSARFCFVRTARDCAIYVNARLCDLRQKDVGGLLADRAIVGNRSKIEAAMYNASFARRTAGARLPIRRPQNLPRLHPISPSRQRDISVCFRHDPNAKRAVE
jgi:DNA-3-methyladenine glycosylase I